MVERIQIAEKMQAARETVRRLLRDDYEKTIGGLVSALREIATAKGEDPFAFAVAEAGRAEGAGKPYAALQIIAAACEIAAPEALKEEQNG